MATPSAGLIPCPACGRTLPSAAGSCPGCGIRLSGPDAARLWQVDQSIGALATERATLLHRLQGPEPSTDPPGHPGHPSGQPQQQLPAVAGSRSARPGPASPPAASWTVQQLLLSGGVVLLLVAALVFVAVSWERLGTIGQVAVLASATVMTMLAARLLARRGLHASAEAVAVLTCGLALLDVVSIRQFGLFGSDRISGDTYWTLGLPVLALTLLLGRLATPAARSYPVLTVLTVGSWPIALASALDLQAGGFTVVAAVASVLGVLNVTVTRSARASVRFTVALVSTCWFVVGSLVALVDATLHAPWDRGALSTSSLLVITFTAVGASRRTRTTGPVRATTRASALLLALVSALVVLHHLGPWTMVALSATGAAALALPALRTSRAVRPAAISRMLEGRIDGALGQRSGAVWLVALTWGAGLVVGTEDGHHRVHLSAWLAVACLGGAARAFTEGTRPRRAWSAYAAVPGALAVGVTAGALPTSGAEVTALCTVGALVLAAAMIRRGRAEEAGLGVGAALTLTLAIPVATDSPHAAELIALVLAVAGVMLLAYSSMPERGIAAIPAVVLCSAATWSLSTAHDITLIEAYTLPLAALALGVGLVRQHRVPDAPSWSTTGPGLSAGLLPSALATYGDEALTRPLLVLLAGVLVVAGGVAVQQQAPVVTGVLATVLVAVSQAGPWVVALPRAASLGVAGVLLLAMGLRYEATRHQARSAGRWVRGLG